MPKLLYLTSSSYSGSTLFTFLVNQHPDIFTIGELEGWDYKDEDYRCSCGEPIETCPFFTMMSEIFKKNNLNYSSRNFGTKLILSKNDAINRYLTSSIPHLDFSFLEKIRDLMLNLSPRFKTIIKNVKKSNKLFVESALNYSGAKVFVDATKNPHRLRMLDSIDGIELQVLYMVRDVRGVVASNARKKGISIKSATLKWLREQQNIIRIIDEFPEYAILHYEDMCVDPQGSLAAIYAQMGLDTYIFGGEVRSSEHHILGNAMRVSDINKIHLDERWKSELDSAAIGEIERICRDYVSLKNNQKLSAIVSHYINPRPGASA